MHLGLIIPKFAPRRGGAEGYAVTVSRILVQDFGVRLDVFTEEPPESPETAGLGVRIRHTPDAGSLARAVAAAAPEVTVDWGLHRPADLHRLGGGVHRAFLEYNLLGQALPARLWKRWIEYRLPKHRRILRREQALLARPEDHFLAVSRFVAEQIRPAIPETRIRVLHNGVDTRRFHPAASPAERLALRRKLGLGGAPVPVFLFVGHNLHRKNFALLEAVFTRLAPDFPEAKVWLLGRTPPRRRAPWLEYLGNRSNPELIYRAADVLLHPAWYDPCSNAVLEALASGLAVVSSDFNGSAEIIRSGRDGYVLPVWNETRRTVLDAWIDTLRRLLVDPEHLEALKRAARKLAEAHAIEKYAADFLGILRQLSEHKRSGRRRGA